MLKSILRVCALLAATGYCCISAPSALADAISPRIHKSEFDYSNEKPNTAFYGTGVTGRLTEASALRFEGERETADGHFDIAIAKLGKAVQLDPGDPEGHLLYARAISAKICAPNGNPSLELVQRGLQEWRLLWHHDADQTEQFEAKFQVRRLSRVAKAIETRIKKEEKEQSLVAGKTGKQID